MGHGENGLRTKVGWMDKVVHVIAGFSILVNKAPINFFNNSRGLKKGNLLSPYLFVSIF